MNRRRFPLFGVGAALWLAGCLDRTVTEPMSTSTAALLTPASAWLEPGASLQLTFTDPSTGAPSSQTLFESSDENVVRVGRDGRVTAIAPGAATIRVLSPSRRGQAHITVVDGAHPSRQWSFADKGLTDVSLLGAWTADARTSFAVGQLGTILRTSDGGQTWQKMPNDNPADLVGVWGTSATNVYAVGANGTILHYDGGGWSPQPAPTDATLLEVWGLAPDAIYAVGVSTALRFDGQQWISMPGAAGAELWAVWGSDRNTLFASGQNGVLLRSDGQSWTPMQSPTSIIIFGLWGTDRANVYGAGIQGTILHFDGERWSKLAVPTTADFFAIDGVDRQNILAVGNTGTMLLYNGEGWSVVPQRATGENLRASTYVPGVGWRVVGWSGTVIRQSAAGWTNELSAATLSGLAELTDGRLLAVGARGAIYGLESGRWTLEAIPTTRDLYGVAELESHETLVVGDSGTVLRRSAGGPWQIDAAPAKGLLRSIWTDGLTPAATFVVGEGGTILQYTGHAWTRMASPTQKFLRHVFGVSRSNVYAVGDTGTVLHYDGTSWRAEPVPTTATLRSVWASGPNDVIAVGEGGTILRFDGVQWYRMASPTTRALRAVIGLGPTEVYAVGENGIVFRFDGATWTSLPSPTSSILLGLSLRRSVGAVMAFGATRTILQALP